jgi:hypothetical protein
VRGMRYAAGRAGLRRAVRIAAAISISTALCGCIAAALVPLVAEGGAIGFGRYKLFQTAGGGSVGIDFLKGPDGKTLPPQPIPAVHRVAVWPGDVENVHFAEKLQNRGRYDVVGPASVSMILTDTKTSNDLRQMTDHERDAAFSVICRRTAAAMVFGGRPLGTTANTNSFSFSYANITMTEDLFGYSCAKRQVVWRDQLTAVAQISDSNASNSEIDGAAGDAWGDRVLQAPAG